MLYLNKRQIAFLALFFPAVFLAAAPVEAAPNNDAIAALRARQERLQVLDFAIKEAELIARLCNLRPTSAECSRATRPVQQVQEVQASRTKKTLPPLVSNEPRILEIYGSNGRFKAVLLDTQGVRRIVRSGINLDTNTLVKRVSHDSVTLQRSGKSVTLLLKN